MKVKQGKGLMVFMCVVLFIVVSSGCGKEGMDNQGGIKAPPNTPSIPSGPSSGNVGTLYTFSSSTTDPDGDDIAIRFDWGDGNYSDWSSWVSSGTPVSMSHSWSSEGTYYVKAQAKDVQGATSDWSPVHQIVISISGWIDTFETYASGAWPSSNWVQDANGGSVDNTVYYEGTKSLKITGQIGGCWAGLGYRALNVPPPFYVEAWVKNGTEALSGCHPYRGYIGMRKGTSWRNPGRQFVQFDGTNNILGTGGGQISTYTPGSWHKIKVKYERPTTNTVKVTYWINDSYITEETVSASSDEDSLNNLDLTCQEGSCWFDEVKVYSAQ